MLYPISNVYVETFEWYFSDSESKKYDWRLIAVYIESSVEKRKYWYHTSFYFCADYFDWYYGDQNDGGIENRSNISEVVGYSVGLSGEKILCFLF
jgi:hypothetical protein